MRILGTMMPGLACIALTLLSASRAIGATSLEQLASPKFGRLTQAESLVLHLAPTGETARCGPSSSVKETEPANDPSQAARWGNTRTIRSSLIRWLYVDPRAVSMIALSGLSIHGAYIDGKLDMSRIKTDLPLQLLRSAIPKGIDLSESDVRLLDLGGSWTGAIRASNLVVRGDLLLNHGFHADGVVNLNGAKIQGALNCREAKILIPKKEDKGDKKGQEDKDDEDALLLLAANVEGNADFADLQTNKRIELSLSNIGGNLSFIRARFDGGRASGLSAINTQVKGALAWVNIKPNRPDIWLDLTFARVGALADYADSWPTYILMNEFVYDRFDEPPEIPKDLPSRLRWLGKQPEFRPQPYMQLARVFRGVGRDHDATAVLIVKDQLERENGATLFRPVQLSWSWFLRSTTGYGHAPIRALGWSAAIVVLGWLAFARGYRARLMVPTEKEACVRFTETQHVPFYYQPFSSFIYSLETFLPFVDLHQIG